MSDFPCDLCGSRLPSLTEFNSHVRGEHGVSSMKPRQIARDARAVMAASPLGDLPMTVADAQAIQARFAREDAERAERRARASAVEFDLTQAQLKAGWLTVRLAPSGVTSLLGDSLEMLSRSQYQYVYHREGSWVQLVDERARAQLLANINDYANSEFGTADDQREAARIATVLDTMQPWVGARGRYV